METDAAERPAPAGHRGGWASHAMTRTAVSASRVTSLVLEDSTRDERLHVVLSHAENRGWRVVWRHPIADSLTYCPAAHPR